MGNAALAGVELQQQGVGLAGWSFGFVDGGASDRGEGGSFAVGSALSALSSFFGSIGRGLPQSLIRASATDEA